ncbi:phage prohead protease, HK97 family [Methylobacterium sp. UNC378MF]|nr:phage prohead protease, HK97 family [Methylobacterium sp. UNC378MF]
MPGSAKIEDGRGLARIQLSKAPGVADTVQKIREGVIRNVSVGYWVHKVEKTEADDGTVARWDVVDWEPLEISAVPIPADAASQIRSDQAEGDGPKLRACLVVTRTPASGPSPKARGESPMATKPVKPKSQRAKSPAELEAEKKRLAEARRRAAEQRAARDDESETDEDAEGDAERDEDQDEERDGDDAEDGDAGSDDERDGDDHAEDDEDRDGDDEDDGEGERAAPKPAKRKALTPAEVRRAAEAAVRADRVRGAKIREIAKQFGFPNLGERHANGETSVRAFKDLVLERLAARQAKRSSTTFAAASTAGVGEEYRGATPPARDVEKGAAEARALLGKK